MASAPLRRLQSALRGTLIVTGSKVQEREAMYDVPYAPRPILILFRMYNRSLQSSHKILESLPDPLGSYQELFEQIW